MSTQQHTPTPLALPIRIDSSNEVFADHEGGESYSEFLVLKDANGNRIAEFPGHSQYAHGSDAVKLEDDQAAYIVRAVNCHEAMREALTECADVMERAQKLLRVAGLTMEGGAISQPYNDALNKARAALALAGGEKS